MRSLMEGIVSHFNSTSTGARKAIYTDVGGRFYFDLAKENASMPYITYSFVGSNAEYTFTTTFEYTVVQFSLFSQQTALTEVTNMFEDLKTAFDDCQLTTTGFTHLRFKRSFWDLERNDETEHSYWQYVCQYDVLLEKQ